MEVAKNYQIHQAPLKPLGYIIQVWANLTAIRANLTAISFPWPRSWVKDIVAWRVLGSQYQSNKYEANLETSKKESKLYRK